ncbi:hypothetical protein ACTXT7_007100 [Hymenolepis weldensis]
MTLYVFPELLFIRIPYINASAFRPRSLNDVFMTLWLKTLICHALTCILTQVSQINCLCISAVYTHADPHLSFTGSYATLSSPLFLSSLAYSLESSFGEQLKSVNIKTQCMIKRKRSKDIESSVKESRLINSRFFSCMQRGENEVEVVKLAYPFIISRDGNCGLNYEHSVAEGVAVIRLIEYILKYMQEVKRWQFVRHTSICSLPEPTKLRWNVDDNTQTAINEALSEIDRLV